VSSTLATESAAAGRLPLTRERIVGAALAVLDAEGFAALTMRRVARELGAGTMSLYRHVASREELLDLVLDELAFEVPVAPPDGAWQASVRELARGARAALLRRRDLTLLLTARLGQGPVALGSLDQALGTFLRAGFPPRDAARANHALGAYVAGSCAWEAVGLGGSGDPAERALRAAEAAAALAAVPADAFPSVAATADELFAGTAAERFEYGLEILVAGLEARLAAIRAAGTRGARS